MVNPRDQAEERRRRKTASLVCSFRPTVAARTIAFARPSRDTFCLLPWREAADQTHLSVDLEQVLVASLSLRLEITIPVGWALNTNN